MKKAIPRKILLSLAVVILATLVAAPMVLAAGTATRDLPAASVAPSANFDVGIVASGLGFGGQVKETLPAGFTYVSCSDPGIGVSQTGQEVRFTIFGDTANFTYTVQASATPAVYTFAGVVIDDLLGEYTVGGDTSLTVAPNGGTHTLTVNVSPAGAGTVAKNPDQAQYADGTTVTLTANANAGYRFSNWSGHASGTANPTTVTMDADKTVTANFVASTTFASWLYETFIEPYMS